MVDFVSGLFKSLDGYPVLQAFIGASLVLGVFVGLIVWITMRAMRDNQREAHLADGKPNQGPLGLQITLNGMLADTAAALRCLREHDRKLDRLEILLDHLKDALDDKTERVMDELRRR